MSLMEQDFIYRVLKKENIATTNVFAGIKQFQKKYGIEQTASIGPKTRAKLTEIYRKFSLCSVATVTPTTNAITTTATTAVPVSPAVATPVAYKEPPYLELFTPKGGDIVDQGVGKTLTVLWTSKYMNPNDDVVVELIGENYESVIKTWKTKNTGRLEISSDDLDSVVIGYFNLRIRYFCNSETIPCSEVVTDAPFSIYPKTGYIAGVLHLRTPLSGKVFYVNESSYLPVDWYTYEKSTDYYNVYLGNVVLGKEVYVDKIRSYGLSIKVKDIKEIKKGMTKSEAEIQNAYYVRIKAIKKGNGVNDEEKVLKEAVSAQFGIR